MLSGSSWVGFGLARKYQTKFKGPARDKHASLLGLNRKLQIENVL